jgi:hypothetical protein
MGRNLNHNQLKTKDNVYLTMLPVSCRTSLSERGPRGWKGLIFSEGVFDLHANQQLGKLITSHILTEPTKSERVRILIKEF